jgi:hypothetical protein
MNAAQNVSSAGAETQTRPHTQPRASRDTFATEALVPGFVAPEMPADRSALAAAQADHDSRHWTSAHAGTIRPGTDAHKREVRRMFHETFNPFRPSVIAWPKLGADALQRVTSLPIWDIAVQTEGKARLRMAAYAGSIDDTDMRAAIALNAWEENRHKEVLSKLVEAYGISLASEPPYEHPRDAEWAYLVTGYSECIDSFFAFGLFELARRSGFFPAELVETFEPVMQDECRHILLFANWVAWHRANLPWWRRMLFELRVAAVYAFLGWERIGLARSLDADGNEVRQDNNFTITGAHAVSNHQIRVADLLRLCVAENERRFAGYDRRLLRPTTMPALVKFALRFVRS